MNWCIVLKKKKTNQILLVSSKAQFGYIATNYLAESQVSLNSKKSPKTSGLSWKGRIHPAAAQAAVSVAASSLTDSDRHLLTHCETLANTLPVPLTQKTSLQQKGCWWPHILLPPPPLPTYRAWLRACFVNPPPSLERSEKRLPFLPHGPWFPLFTAATVYVNLSIVLITFLIHSQRAP